MTEWQPISTAPDLDRVMVCGWHSHHKSSQGYWYWNEDFVCQGKASRSPDATHWAPIVLPPFPKGPSV